MTVALAYHVYPHHKWMRMDDLIATPVAVCFATHPLANSLICAEIASTGDLGYGLPREGTNEDTSAPVRAKGRRIMLHAIQAPPSRWR